jgi:hypothetical protein
MRSRTPDAASTAVQDIQAGHLVGAAVDGQGPGDLDRAVGAGLQGLRLAGGDGDRGGARGDGGEGRDRRHDGREGLGCDEAAALVVEAGGEDRAHHRAVTQVRGVREHAVRGIDASARLQRHLVAAVGHGVGQRDADVAADHRGAIEPDVGQRVERELIEQRRRAAGRGRHAGRRGAAGGHGLLAQGPGQRLAVEAHAEGGGVQAGIEAGRLAAIDRRGLKAVGRAGGDHRGLGGRAVVAERRPPLGGAGLGHARRQQRHAGRVARYQPLRGAEQRRGVAMTSAGDGRRRQRRRQAEREATAAAIDEPSSVHAGGNSGLGSGAPDRRHESPRRLVA